MFKFIQETDSNQYLGYLVAGEHYCINLQKLHEIIYIPSISKIPNVPSYVEGAINLRGKIVRVLNLHKWFRLPWSDYSENSRILVVDINDLKFGLLVDQILDVFSIESEEKNELPTYIIQDSEISYIKSIIDHEEQLFIEIKPSIIRTEK